MTDPLGRLQPVDPRDVWRHEAGDFTPWLLANADVLSDALGMDLDLRTAEHAVGAFALDLIGTDRATGDVVIVENQLEVSDHAHLGQILTYAGGTDPRHIVWIATGFRQEHRAALEWLNERTGEATRFFAIQLQTVRIGDSPPAPLFTPMVQPNDWGKQVRATTTSGREWGEDDFLEALSGAETGAREAARKLYDHSLAAAPGASLYWGIGQRPSMTPQIPAGAVTFQPWSYYSAGGPDGSPLWAVNFDWIYKNGRGVSNDVMEEFADRLRAIPVLVPHIDQACSARWRKRPSVPVTPLFADPDALATITKALDQLYAAALTERADAHDGAGESGWRS
jgi:hypothetical protein